MQYCVIQRGYYHAYRKHLRESIDDCVASCEDLNCPIILAGHSQGGAAAAIASVDLQHYDPTVRKSQADQCSVLLLLNVLES